MSYLYVIETDASCKWCGGRHDYVTKNCTLSVFTDYAEATWVAKHIEGSAVREIRDVPKGISYQLYTKVPV